MKKLLKGKNRNCAEARNPRYVAQGSEDSYRNSLAY